MVAAYHFCERYRNADDGEKRLNLTVLRPDQDLTYLTPLILDPIDSIGDQLARCINGVNLNDAFCQIGANSCNLTHGTSPS